MSRARIVIKRDGVVTLNGDTVGRVYGHAPAQRYGVWDFKPASPTGACGGPFSRNALYLIRRELYRRLSAPLSGR